eukprot:5513162-Amphidinium_carterae.1
MGTSCGRKWGQKWARGPFSDKTSVLSQFFPLFPHLSFFGFGGSGFHVFGGSGFRVFGGSGFRVLAIKVVNSCLPSLTLRGTTW